MIFCFGLGGNRGMGREISFRLKRMAISSEVIYE